MASTCKIVCDCRLGPSNKFCNISVALVRGREGVDFTILMVSQSTPSPHVTHIPAKTVMCSLDRMTDSGFAGGTQHAIIM